VPQQPTSPGQQAGQRLVALDWLRGFVMLLMTLDHASIFYDAGRLSHDSAASYQGEALPLGQFLMRWVTHLCAPTFVFLAGTSLALSRARRLTAGHDTARMDRDQLLRGAFIVALDLGYLSLLAQHRIFQVLYAIGLSMILMVPLARLPARVLVAGALGWFAFGEGLTLALWHPPVNASLPVALTVGQYSDAKLSIIYPVVPWLAMMALGWAFGLRLHARGAEHAQRWLLGWGAAGLVLFALVRGAAGYGNMALQRQDGSLAQWLHASKYPPSLSYAALELGLMALALAACMALATRWREPARGPVLVFGQTALFFYLAHFTLLGLSRPLLGLPQGGVPGALLAALVTWLVLYPCCLWYRGYKRAHPDGWARFV
jgi:uncharacterized membrane protein